MIKIGVAQFNNPQKNIKLKNLFEYLDENKIEYKVD